MRTIIGLNDPKAVKKYSGNLAVDVPRSSYWGSTMMSRGADPKTPIHRLDDLEGEEGGDRVTFDLSLQLRGQPIEGDERAEDDAEDLKFATDIVFIDQMRRPVSAGGKMTRKRTLHNLRTIAKARLREWFARAIDELIFMYMSGARGINADYVWRAGYGGFANNPMTAPDTLHQIYGGAATSKATLTSSHGMDLTALDRAKVRAVLIGGGGQGIPAIQPCRVGGQEKFVVVMSPHQHYAIRTNTATGQYIDIQKAIASAIGTKSPLTTGAIGEYNGLILHEHKATVRFNDYGAGANVDAARALFLGRQAGLVAFGDAGESLPFNWVEQTADLGNELIMAAGAILGVKKASFVTQQGGPLYDFGVISIDTWINSAL